MTQEEQVALMIRGAVAQLPQEDQMRIVECEAKIRALIAEYGEAGRMAIALIGADIAAEVS